MTRSTPRPSSLCAVLAALLLTCGGNSIAWAQTYSFGGFDFDQADTPDSGLPLSPATYGGAIITANPTSSASGSAGFPLVASGFDSSLSLGRLLGLASSGVRALNLPAGNVGTSARSGILLSWADGRRLGNETGDDFVVFEGGSNGTSPEGLMVQVRNADNQVWSRWRYEIADNFTLYVGESSEGAFAHAFDLDSFGIGSFEEIDAIRVANLTDEDRIDAPGTEISPGVFVAEGFVLPEDAGSTSSVFPDPGPLASFPLFGSATLDPDPLYVAMLVSPNICGDGTVRDAETCDDGNTLDFDGCSALCQVEIPQTQRQKACIKGVHRVGFEIASVQQSVDSGCLRSGVRGETDDAQACLTDDDYGRIAGARRRSLKLYELSCRAMPDFGETDVNVVMDGASAEAIDLVADVFGADLEAAAVDVALDKSTATCQVAVAQALDGIASAMRRQVKICIRQGLQLNTILAAAGLDACMDAIDADPRLRVFRAVTRLEQTLLGTCVGVDTDTAFPGDCVGDPSFQTCLVEQVRCRTCRTLNVLGALTRDCDAFDDGTRNGTCPLP